MRQIALRSAYHAPWLGTTHPMSPATFRSRRCFLLQTQAVLSWASHVDERSATLLLRYSYASTLLPVACLLRSALFSDSCCSGTMCGCRQILYRVWCTCTGVEALRQLVMMPALASVSSCRSTHICRQSPSTYCRAALVPLAVSFLHVSCGQAAQFCIREEYDTRVE